jgi:hypothetical protein
MIAHEPLESQLGKMRLWKPRSVLFWFYSDTKRHLTWPQQAPSHQGRQTSNDNQNGEIFCGAL